MSKAPSQRKPRAPKAPRKPKVEIRKPVPFDPLNRRNLAASAAEALLETEPEPLDSLKPFVGVGVYAIYYTGDFPAYAKVAEANRDGKWLSPIYVGKAIPKGGRKGGTLEAEVGRELESRLKDHARSIRAASSTLKIEDFFARYLVVEDIWTPLVETLMISHFAPIWNNPLDGFGNHTPGAGRFKGMRPRWDVVHPGRAWAAKCAERNETSDTITGEITALLDARPEPRPLKILRQQLQAIDDDGAVVHSVDE